MEKAYVTAVTHDTSEAMVRIRRVPDRPGIAARILSEIARENINVDVILQNISADGQTDLSFTIPKEDLARSSRIIEKIAADIGAEGQSVDHEIATVSLVGAGMKTHPGVAAEMFTALADAEINIEAITTSSIRILCVVRASEVERAVQLLHDHFDLPEVAGTREH